MSYETNQILQGMESLEDRLQKLHSEFSDRSDDSARQFNRAFEQAQEYSKARYDALKELTEQMKIGQAMEALRYGFQNEMFHDKTKDMYDLYSQLSSRVIEDARQIVSPSAQRGSEFDDIVNAEKSLNETEFY